MNSYSARLVALLLAAMLPVVAIATALVVHAARQERRTIEAEAEAKVGHLVDLVNREITADLRVLEALATSASLDGPDLQRFHDQARRVLASQPDWLTLLLLDREGWQLMSACQPLGREPVRVVEPRSFEETVRTGSATVGPLSEPSPTSGIRAVPLRVPVWRDGQLRHVLTAPVKADSFGRLLSAGLPVDGWVVAVADQNGRLVARSRDLEAQAGRPLDADAIAAIRSGTPGGLYRGKGFDGADVIATFATVGETGWTVHLGVPLEAYEGPRRRAMLAAALGGLGSVALAAALAWLIRRDLAARRREAASSRQVRAMEAIGRMTGGVAHDFNNALAVIRSAAELLRRRPDDLRREFFLDSIVQATERGAKLTRQLLSFAGRRAAQPEVVDLAARVAAIGELMRSSLGDAIELRVELPPTLWPVEVDPAELELALLNLASNARDAMPGGGVLRLTARNVTLPRSGEGTAASLAGDHVRLAVSDEGTGMTPAVVERAFEPFYTTKERGKGTGLGLGLSQVYGFTRQAGGAVIIQSRPGAGTSVVLYLPRTSKMPSTTAPATDSVAVGPLRLLVVEDDRAVTSGTAALLRELGHMPVVTETADEALERLARSRSFDLVFSDIVMPGGMNGVQLAHEVRRRHPGLPVLLATGYALGLEKEVEVPQGVRVLRKPYGLETLKAAIEECVAAKGTEEIVAVG